LDVFEQEPLETTSPLLAEDLAHKLILTPHLGASTEEAQVNVALDVAEQIRDFLTTGAVRSAVNLPLLRSDLLDPVRPFMPLVENLAKVLRQLASGPATQLEIRVKGALTEKNLAPLSLAALKGLLSQNREGVTYVNAPLLAKAQGLVVSEVKVPGEGSFANLVTLVLHTPQGQVCVAGTLLGNNLQRIVDLDGFKASLKPTAHMLMVPHEDKPGMVAKVATVLGNAGINIASLQVGQKLETQANTSASVMIFNLEAPVPAPQLQAITAIEGCFGATLLQV
jgi:D-3-phosphoglycerate dehydrogenase